MKRSKETTKKKSSNKIPALKEFAFRPLRFEEIVALNSASSSSRDELEEGRQRRPQPRSGHRIACSDSSFYSFGGYLETSQQTEWPPHLVNGNQRLFQELWTFNYSTHYWRKLPTPGNPPKELASHSTILHGNYLLVFGGTGVPFGSCSSNKLNICDLRSLEWKTLETTGTPPTPQYGQAVVLDRNNFYVVGGTTGFEYSIDVHCLNLKSLEWERLWWSGRGDIFEPPRRYRHELGYIPGKIFLLGGGTATEAFDLQCVWVFDTSRNNWSQEETIPTTSNKFPAGRKCQGSVQLGSDVYICGGYDSSKIFSDLWKLNLETMTWTEFAHVKMPRPLYFHSAGLGGCCMYTFGGVTDIEKNTRTNKIFKIWLKIPKLKEICWEACLHYFDVSNSDNLLSLGVPREFVGRLKDGPPGGNGDWGSVNSGAAA